MDLKHPRDVKKDQEWAKTGEARYMFSASRIR